MTFPSTPWRATQGLALSLGVAALLSGCGGASTSTKSFGSYTPNGPIVFGLNAVGALQSNPPQFRETSGAGTTDLTGGYAVAALSSTALPLANEVDGTTGTIPLGFAPGARYIDNATYGQALHPNDQFVFGAYAANALDSTGNFIDITGLSLQSTDPNTGLGIASQPMTYAPKYTGPLANAQYKSVTLTIPSNATTGIKTLSVTISDKSPNTTDKSPSTTTFGLVVLAGNDSAVLAQITNTDAKSNVNPVSGAVATIDGADAPGYALPGQANSDPNASVSDTQGVVLLFAPAGMHTITVTGSILGPDHKTPVTVTGTLTITTVARQISGQASDGSALTISTSVPASGSALRAK